eukprot:4872606-Pyramimonas_sp.AAC.2
MEARRSTVAVMAPVDLQHIVNAVSSRPREQISWAYIQPTGKQYILSRTVRFRGFWRGSNV